MTDVSGCWRWPTVWLCVCMTLQFWFCPTISIETNDNVCGCGQFTIHIQFLLMKTDVSAVGHDGNTYIAHMWLCVEKFWPFCWCCSLCYSLISFWSFHNGMTHNEERFVRAKFSNRRRSCVTIQKFYRQKAFVLLWLPSSSPSSFSASFVWIWKLHFSADVEMAGLVWCLALIRV